MQAMVTDGVETMQAVRLTVPAKPEYITLGRLALVGLALLRPDQFSPEVLGDVKLALTEACTNSVRHAYGVNGGVAQALEPHDGDAELSVGGLGLAIIDALSDELAITKGGSGGSTLRFVKHLS